MIEAKNIDQLSEINNPHSGVGEVSTLNSTSIKKDEAFKVSLSIKPI